MLRSMLRKGARASGTSADNGGCTHMALAASPSILTWQSSGPGSMPTSAALAAPPLLVVSQEAAGVVGPPAGAPSRLSQRAAGHPCCCCCSAAAAAGACCDGMRLCLRVLRRVHGGQMSSSSTRGGGVHHIHQSLQAVPPSPLRPWKLLCRLLPLPLVNACGSHSPQQSCQHRVTLTTAVANCAALMLRLGCCCTLLAAFSADIMQQTAAAAAAVVLLLPAQHRQPQSALTMTGAAAGGDPYQASCQFPSIFNSELVACASCSCCSCHGACWACIALNCCRSSPSAAALDGVVIQLLGSAAAALLLGQLLQVLPALLQHHLLRLQLLRLLCQPLLQSSYFRHMMQTAFICCYSAGDLDHMVHLLCCCCC